MPAETDCMKDISLNPKRESFGWDWLCSFSDWIMELFIMRSIVSFSSPKKEERCRGVDQNRTFPKPPVVAASRFLSLLWYLPLVSWLFQGCLCLPNPIKNELRFDGHATLTHTDSCGTRHHASVYRCICLFITCTIMSWTKPRQWNYKMTTKQKKAENGNSVSFRMKFVVHWGAALVLGCSCLSWSHWVAQKKKCSCKLARQSTSCLSFLFSKGS